MLASWIWIIITQILCAVLLKDTVWAFANTLLGIAVLEGLVLKWMLDRSINSASTNLELFRTRMHASIDPELNQMISNFISGGRKEQALLNRIMYASFWIMLGYSCFMGIWTMLNPV